MVKGENLIVRNITVRLQNLFGIRKAFESEYGSTVPLHSFYMVQSENSLLSGRPNHAELTFSWTRSIVRVSEHRTITS